MIRRYMNDKNPDDRHIYLCDDCAEEDNVVLFDNGDPCVVDLRGYDGLFVWINDDEDADHSCEVCNTSALDELPI